MKHRIGSLLILCLLVMPQALHACAVCYGESDSPLAQGMNWGIMTLLGVIGSVMAGIISFFVFVGRRAATLQAASTLESPDSKDD